MDEDDYRSPDRYGADLPEALRPHEQIRGWGCVSWLFIFVLVGLRLYAGSLKADDEVTVAPLDDSAASMQGIPELQVRTMIGLGELMRQTQPGKESDIRALFEGVPGDVASQAQHAAMWNRGTLGQRLQYVILGGELSGPRAASRLLSKIRADLDQARLEPTADQITLLANLRKLYQDFRKDKFDAPSLNAAEREQILTKLGWYGRLALTPPKAPDQIARQAVVKPALRLMIGLVGVMGVMIVMGLLGGLGLLAFGVAAILGSLRIGLREGSGSGGVYAETFALWMFCFMGAQIAAEFWPWKDSIFLLNLAVFFGSLLVLIWPVVRGVPWSQVCADIGLTRGRAGLAEPVLGIPAYAMMLPMLAVGFAITLVLLLSWTANGGVDGGAEAPFQPQQSISHPVVNVVLQGQGGFWLKVQLILLACVAAPIVEEIMFRGVLYRHLRDATRGIGWIASCLVSALWTSFIFAVIHPQGLIAVPALMGIACGCTLAREWRDSLWASMIVHSINNSMIFTVLMIASH